MSMSLPKHEIIVAETSESWWVNDWTNGEMDDIDSLCDAGDMCIVTVDNTVYICEAYDYVDGYGVCIGDSRLYDDTSHPEVVPFFVIYYCDKMMGRNIHQLEFYYPDSETHTIEIQRVVKSSVLELVMPKHEVVVAETTKNYVTFTQNNGFYKYSFDCDYIIILDDVSYHCTPWMKNGDGLFRLGDSRIVNDTVTGEPDQAHPENVPFYIDATYLEGTGTEMWYFSYPDSEAHTIEIQKVVPSNVKQIADVNGRILWAAIPKVKVTIASHQNGANNNSASIAVYSILPFAPDPSKPNDKKQTWAATIADAPNCTIEIPVGSTIKCTITGDNGVGRSYIRLNGASVVTGEGSYNYTVSKNVSITMEEIYVDGDYGRITIVEEND